MFRRVLIANRGEIAVRIIRACRELCIGTVAVYSDADARAMHVQLADSAVCIGPPPPNESYLNVEKILEAAQSTGCDGLHPGYGFLSENARFAEAVMATGLGWIGPPPAAIRQMGLKVESRILAEQAGVPIVPGDNGPDWHRAAKRVGYPVLVKASAGGGGKGMRVVTQAEGLEAALAAAQREAQAAFGDDRVYLEKYVVRPRHIEIQVLADTHGNCIHLGERECSIQRRHQKVLEEAPSSFVSSELRAEMGARAVALAQAVEYVGAGTVEFIVAENGAYYFLEMNTRLQVEHPVTELVQGLDLVQWQLRIAAGERLNGSLLEAPAVPRGHAIEVRICAEDPAAGFLPQTGRVDVYREPQGPGIRVDTALYAGWEVGADYDPMLAKLVVYGAGRSEALARLRSALADYRILGIQTNLDLLRALAAHPALAAGETHTGFISDYFVEWQPASPDLPVKLAAVLASASGQARQLMDVQCNSADQVSPWQSYERWSNVRAGESHA